MVLVKNLKIFYLSILGKTGQNNTFRDILGGKNVYLDNKNKKLKKSKHKKFSKGDSPWVMSKNWKFFHLFIWGKISPENASNDILQSKNAFLDYEKQELNKVEKRAFFQRGGSMLLVKNFKFCHLYICGKIGQEYAFYDILERNNAFSDYKNKKLIRTKN